MNLFKIFGQIALDTAEAEEGLSHVGKSAEKTESKMGKAFDKIGSAAVACGKVIATGLAAGATAFGALATKALNLAGDLEQNLGGAEAVFGEFASKMEEHASKAFASMGLSASDYLATANKMGSLFKGAGFEAGEAADLTAEAMQRAADVASIMGIDVSVAMESVAGAAKGNFTMMDNLGVAMNDTNLQAYALSKGIKTATKDMTSQEKIGLAMKMFLEKTADYAGNYAKENETLAGSLTTAKAAFSNFLSGVGDASEVGAALVKAGKVITKKLTALLPALVSGIGSLLNSLIPELPPLLESLLPALIDGAVALVNGLVSAGGQIVNALMGIAPDLIDAAMQLMETIGSALIDNIDFILDSALQIVMMLGQALLDNAPRLASAACTLVEKLGDWIAENAETIVTSGVKLMATLGATIAKEIPKLIGTAAKAVVKALPALLNGFASLWENLNSGLMIVLGLLVAFKGYAILTTITSCVTKLKTAFIALNSAMRATPWGMVISAVGLGVSGLGALFEATNTTAKMTHQFSDEFLVLRDSINASQEALDGLEETYSQNANTILDETKRTEELWEELQTLCDETGYVDEANKNRADYILGELNKALGTEYELNGNIIGQYQQMQAEIDTLIQKRQAERLFASYEDQMTEAQTNLGTRKQEMSAAKAEWDNYYTTLAETGNAFADFVNRVNSDERLSYKIDIDPNAYKIDPEAAMAAFGDVLAYHYGDLGNYAPEASTLMETMSKAYSPESENQYEAAYNDAAELYRDAERTMQRYQDAEAALISGDFQKATDLLLDVANAYWYQLENGGSITADEREILRSELKVEEDALTAYRQGLASGDSMLSEERYNELLTDFLGKLELFGSGYIMSKDTKDAINATTYTDHTGGEQLDALDEVIPRTSEGIAISPVSFADEEKSALTGMTEKLETLISLMGEKLSELILGNNALATSMSTLTNGGLTVKMNSREFGRMVRTVKE